MTPRPHLERHLGRRLGARLIALVALGSLAFAATACGSEAGSTGNQAEAQEGRLRVTNVTVDRPILDQTAVRLVVRNDTAQGDELIRVSSPIASAAVMHRTVTDAQGRSTMEPVSRVAVPARSSVRFDPGGLHVMLTGIDRRPALGDKVRVTFTFAEAGTKTVTARVVRPGATSTEHGHD